MIRLTGALLDPSTLEEYVKKFVQAYKSQERVIHELNEEIDWLRSEHYKDDKLKEMKTEIDMLTKQLERGFFISEEQDKKIKDWIEKHTKEKHAGSSYAGAIGGRYEYIFIPTGLGVIGTIKCTCGDEFEFQTIE